MRKISLLFLLTGVSLLMLAQERTHQNKTTSPQSSLNSPPEKKYSSLLWEITGRGLTRPSYLFGTMHVSDKLAFHLGDSFYNALKSVQMVALETNPDYWQDHFSNSSLY